MDEIYSPHVAKVIEYFLCRHFTGGKAIVSAEVGAGPYGALFAAHAKRHYNLIEFGDAAGAARAAEESAGLSKRRGTRTVRRGGPRKLAWALAWEKIDIFVLGGNHLVPSCQAILELTLERLAPGGILVLPKLDVASTHDLYLVLSSDPRFRLHLVMETVAFFGYDKRVGAKSGMDWTSQSYNGARFPANGTSQYSIPFALPFCLDFSGHLTSMPEELAKGFRIAGGRPVSEGDTSLVRFTLDCPAEKALVIDLKVRPVNPAQRKGAAASVKIGGVELSRHEFSNNEEQVISVNCTQAADLKVEISIQHHGLLRASELTGMPPETPPFSRPSIELLSISARSADDVKAISPIRRQAGAVVSFDHEGKAFSFFVEDSHDSIQAHHQAGGFYELEELELIGKHLKKGARILDVGANIGNHAVYFEKILDASKIVAIELQPRVIEVLRLNATLNRLKAVDLTRLGVGFGARRQTARIEIPQAFNVAGAQFKEDPAGTFKISPGDEVIGNEDFDLVKIDVEGMECDAIEGLSGMINRCKPTLFVEVWNENRAHFDGLMGGFGYGILAEFRRYDVATNLLLKPVKGGLHGAPKKH